ncbi:MAG TPA: CHAT domain-containing tetratricopeptide repeat protein [Nocardioides sp.]|nr:CHAT domain-containing tetratricopeptide repeat protein [Nocardioides sp.]
MQDLLDLALDRPDEARRRAERVLDSEVDDLSRSFAYQCLGIVLRDEGETAAAMVVLRNALRCARRTANRDRIRDVRATLGVTLAFDGHSRAALRELEGALEGAEGEAAARIAVRLAGVLTVLGRHENAIPVLRSALTQMEEAGNLPWAARTRLWLAHVETRLGRIDEAEADVLVSNRILADEGAWTDRLAGLTNLAELAVARGDIATALRRFAEAAEAHDRADWSVDPDFLSTFADTYLAAGLTREAVALLRAFDGRITPLAKAGFLATMGSALLADGDVEGAVDAARQSASLFRRQDRSWFGLRSRLTVVRARFVLGERRGLAREAATVAAELHSQRADETALALTIAGRLANGRDRLNLLTRAASYRTHPNALVRAAAWHAQSLAHEEQHNRGGVLRAAAAGLDAIDEHRRLIGSSELRALATTHGRDLTTIALRHAATDPRTLLRWSERTRATALAQPPATSDAATIPASLAALRDNGRRLAEARAEGEPTDALERERLWLERAVRSESHTLSATTAEQQKPPGVEEIVAAVGDGCLVELVDVDGSVHVLVVHAGRVRRKVAGSTDEITALLGPTQMLLRRASRGRATDMTAVGRQLQDAILGDAARLVPDGPVVLAPTARLHGLAWPLLPLLGDRPFSVVPSAGQWLRARATPRPAAHRRRTLLVSGPNLATGGAEVPLLAGANPDAVLLDGRDATLERVLDQLDGADLVHLAAHGNFRADSPLFSSLDLADGPLTVHDLERVRRAPYRVVLSACESGVLAPVGAEELLGLAAALFSLGTAGLVSSVAEVNDTATADLMVDLHAALATGADPATALHSVRRQTAGDPVAAGTAAAFLALGV